MVLLVHDRSGEWPATFHQVWLYHNVHVERIGQGGCGLQSAYERRREQVRGVRREAREPAGQRIGLGAAELSQSWIGDPE